MDGCLVLWRTLKMFILKVEVKSKYINLDVDNANLPGWETAAFFDLEVFFLITFPHVELIKFNAWHTDHVACY